VLGNATALGSDVTTVNANGGTFRLNGNSTTLGGLTGSSGGIVGNANAAAATVAVSHSGSNAFASVLQDGAGGGALSLSKSGGGTLALTNTNTFTGTTTVSAGTLEAGAAGALGNTTNPNLTGETLLLSNTGTTGRLNDSATVTMAGGTMAFSGNVSEGSSPGVGALTLTANSVIDFAGGNAHINFAASNLASWSSAVRWTCGRRPSAFFEKFPVETTVCPSIIAEPLSVNANAWTTATFTVEALATPSPAYQWRKGGVNIGGATSSSYSVSASASVASYYDVVVTNGAGSLTSTAALLTVVGASGNAPPIAVNDSATTTPAAAVTVNVLTNDSVAESASEGAPLVLKSRYNTRRWPLRSDWSVSRTERTCSKSFFCV